MELNAISDPHVPHFSCEALISLRLKDNERPAAAVARRRRPPPCPPPPRARIAHRIRDASAGPIRVLSESYPGRVRRADPNPIRVISGTRPPGRDPGCKWGSGELREGRAIRVTTDASHSVTAGSSRCNTRAAGARRVGMLGLETGRGAAGGGGGAHARRAGPKSARLPPCRQTRGGRGEELLRERERAGGRE